MTQDFNSPIINPELEDLERELQRIEREEKGKEMESQLREAMAQYHGDDEVMLASDLWEKIKNLPAPHCKFGLAELDNMMGGVSDGNLIVVTAPTGHGKTTFCRYLSQLLAKQGIKSLWFSFEVGLRNFLLGFNGEMDNIYSPAQNKEQSILWTERRIIEAKVKYGVSSVFIDHLDFIADIHGKESEAFQIKQLVYALKNIAIKYGVSIFLISHIKAQQDNEEITINSIKSSSSIAQVADFVICLWREQAKAEYVDRRRVSGDLTNEATIRIVKNRNTGQLGRIKFIYDGNRFLPQLRI